MRFAPPTIASIMTLLLVTSMMLSIPLFVNAQSTDVAYFAVYCPQGGGLSTTYAVDNVLKCHENGAAPLFEKGVSSLTSNPEGTHFVTIIEADCYPDTSQVPQAPTTPTGRIGCGTSPDATLTLGSTFPAASSPSSPSPGPSTGLTPINVGNLPQVPADATSIQTILGIVFGILGALALLMVTVSGLRYILSAGDPQKTAQAKNGIIYALVGVAVAISAEAIVFFVVNRL